MKIGEVYNQLLTEGLNPKQILKIGQQAITDFNSKVKMFKKIRLELLNDDPNAVGEYQHDSALSGVPLIYLHLQGLNSIEDSELVSGIRTTVFHELAHAMVDVDNKLIFRPDENILQYEDEEDFAEEFAFDFDMFGKVSEDVLQLADLFRHKKWIGIDANYEEDNFY